MDIEEETLMPSLSDRLSAARIYDYLLGGFHNFEVDRAVADRMLQAHPDLRLGARVNRAFLRRAVRFLTEQGTERTMGKPTGP